MKFTPRQHATILAALRYWQRHGMERHLRAIDDIATNGGEFDPLSAVEIDELAESLNLCDPDDILPAEPKFDDSVKCCPECETPNQFGETCPSCQRESDQTQPLRRPDFLSQALNEGDGTYRP